MPWIDRSSRPVLASMLIVLLGFFTPQVLRAKVPNESTDGAMEQNGDSGASITDARSKLDDSPDRKISNPNKQSTSKANSKPPHRICSGDPCTRPGLSRLILGSVGAVVMAAGTAILMGISGWAEPAGWFAGGGALAVAGSLVGALASAMSREGQAVAEAPTQPTLALHYGLVPGGVLGERHPDDLRVFAAPAFQLTFGRLRIDMHGGARMGSRISVDPRPQLQEGSPAKFPEVERRRTFSCGFAPDWFVALVYPSPRRKRPGLLGPIELHLRPMYEYRRETYWWSKSRLRIVERHMLIPVGGGFRWHISARQRFSAYLGPRLDFVGFNDEGRRIRHRGRPQLGRFYGEAWYEVDFPFSQANFRPSSVDASGRLRMGYRHSMFNSLFLNAGAIVGFTGPMFLGWAVQVRPHGSKVAWQMSANVWISNRPMYTLEMGIVLPEMSPSKWQRKSTKRSP